jgi:hypothetical protein
MPHDDLTRRVLARASNLADESHHRLISGPHVLCGGLIEFPGLRESFSAAGISLDCLQETVGTGDRPAGRNFPFSPEVAEALDGTTSLTDFLARLFTVDPAVRDAIRHCGAAVDADQFAELMAPLRDVRPGPSPVVTSMGTARVGLFPLTENQDH